MHRARETDTRGQPIASVDSSLCGFRFCYADGTRVWLDRTGDHVWCTRPQESTLEDVSTYIVGPVLAFALRVRGGFALHASAIEVGGTAVAFVGPHGAGKSTVAAALARSGYGVLTDDVLRLRRAGAAWLADPFGGFLRLWPASERMVLGTRDALPRITPTWDKRALPIGTRGTRAVAQAIPLSGIVLLEPRERGDWAPRLVMRPASEVLVRLVTHSSAAHLLDSSQRAAEFADLAALVGTVPAVGAVARDDPAAFPRFLNLLCDWIAGCASHAPRSAAI